LHILILLSNEYMWKDNMQRKFIVMLILI
jgi:hypothetical protein